MYAEVCFCAFAQTDNLISCGPPANTSDYETVDNLTGNATVWLDLDMIKLIVKF